MIIYMSPESEKRKNALEERGVGKLMEIIFENVNPQSGARSRNH